MPSREGGDGSETILDSMGGFSFCCFRVLLFSWAGVLGQSFAPLSAPREASPMLGTHPQLLSYPQAAAPVAPAETQGSCPFWERPADPGHRTPGVVGSALEHAHPSHGASGARGVQCAFGPPRGTVLTPPHTHTHTYFCLSRVSMKSVKATLAGKSRRAWRKQPRPPSSQPSLCPRVGKSWAGRLPSEPSPR